MIHQAQQPIALVLLALFALSIPGGAIAGQAVVSLTLDGTDSNATSEDPPCGTRVNGAILPPGYAACGRPCVDIPNAQITGTILTATDYTGTKPCYGNGRGCDIGWSKFWSTPEIYPKGDHQTVCGNVKNWSDNRPRTFRMVVQYQ
jgi:hypothetical protein